MMSLLLSIVLAALSAGAAGDQLAQAPAQTTVPKKPAQTKAATQTPPQKKPPTGAVTTYVPPAGTPQLQATLTADPNPVQVGENVTFRLVPVTPALAGRFILTYMFDDGSPAVQDGPLEYTRSFAGARDVLVRVGAVVKGVEIFTEPPEIARVTVTVTHAPLTVTPPTVQAGETARLSTVFNSTDRNIRYRFTANSGLTSGWVEQPSAPLTFGAAGTYTAQVEIARLVNNTPVVIDSSDPRDIVVSAAPTGGTGTGTGTTTGNGTGTGRGRGRGTTNTPVIQIIPVAPWWDHWWIGAVATLLVVSAAVAMRGRTKRETLPFVRPEFSAFLDRGPGTRDGSAPITLSYLLVFDTAVADSQHVIDSNGEPLVASLRRRDD